MYRNPSNPSVFFGCKIKAVFILQNTEECPRSFYPRAIFDWTKITLFILFLLTGIFGMENSPMGKQIHREIRYKYQLVAILYIL